MDEVGVALVGCGGMMGAHVQRGFRALWGKGFRSFQIVACVDVNESNAHQIADRVAAWQERRPTVYKSLDAFLSTEHSVAAVDISLPHHEHHTVAVACLEAGKHVLMEKPLALTLRAGRKIIEAARRKGLVLSIAENYRRAPHHRAIHWALRQGWIGEVRQVYWVDAFERRWYWGWRDHKELAGGGWTLDGGVHFADLMRYHVGEVVSVSAQMAAFQPLRVRRSNGREEQVTATIEDTTQALLLFANGEIGVWVETISAPCRRLSLRTIYGANGAVDLEVGFFLAGRTEPVPLDQVQEAFLAQLPPEEKERLFPFGLMDDIAQEIWEFLTACQEGNPKVEVDGEEAYRSQAVCMAVYESATLQQPVRVEAVRALEVEAYQRPINERWQIS